MDQFSYNNQAVKRIKKTLFHTCKYGNCELCTGKFFRNQGPDEGLLHNCTCGCHKKSEAQKRRNAGAKSN